MINNWITNTLEEIAENQKNAIVDGPFGSNLKLSDYVSDGVPVLQGNNITGNSFRFTDIRYISQEKADSLIRSKVVVGDLLIVKIGSVGYSAIVDDLNGYNYAIIPANLLKVSLDKNKVIPQYIYQYLTSPDGIKKLKSMSTSTAQPALSLGKIKQLSIPLPKDIKLQQKIGDILSSVDEAIQKTDQIIQKSEELKNGLMNELLTKGISHKKFKKTKLGEIPEEWEILSLQQMIDTEMVTGHLDGNHGELYPKASEFTDDGIPYISANNLNNGLIDFKGAKFLSLERAKRFKKGVSVNDDVLFAHNATVGPVALLRTEYPFVILSTSLTYYRCNDYKLLPNYLLNFMQSHLFVNQYKRVMSQTTRNQVPITAQRALYHVVPPIEEQKQICKILGSVDSTLLDERLNMMYLKLLKNGLMQDIFSQKVQIN